MELFMVGTGVNIAVALITLAWPLLSNATDGSVGTAFCAFLACSLAYGFATTGGNIYGGLVLPLYFCSSVLAFILPTSSPISFLGAGLVLGMIKTGVCMSVCLHRFAAHRAFQCNGPTRLLLGALGCLANQGGPIWWSSQHRCHHKHCDAERDPHSVRNDGIVGAFNFFDTHQRVVEEFVPAHMESKLMRLLDTFSFVPTMLEHSLAWTYFGPCGLFLSFTSAWICQTGSLWFNIVNHPMPPATQEGAKKEGKKGMAQCLAADTRSKVQLPNIFFKMLNLMVCPLADSVGEAEHLHHHDHSRLAKRPGMDLPYYLFVAPLSWTGLIWSCRVV